MRHRTGVVVSFLLATTGCARSALPPNAASHLSGSIAAAGTSGATKFEVAGSAFAQADPTAHALYVYVFSTDTTPSPTCETLGNVAALTKGTLVSLEIKNFDRKPGRYDIASLGYLSGDAAKGDMSMAGGGGAGTAVQIRTFEAKSMTADLSSTPQAESPTAGTFVATVCPDAEPVAAVATALPPMPSYDLHPVEFAVGSATLTKGARDAADAIAKSVLAAPDVVGIWVDGLTSDTSPASERKLGDNRVKAVTAYLIQKGVPAALFSPQGVMGPDTGPGMRAPVIGKRVTEEVRVSVGMKQK